MLGALLLGLLTAFAIRSRTGPRLRWTVGLAVVTTVAIGVALVVLLPPRGAIDHPQYYAHGADIPRALEAIDTAQRSTRVLDEELDAQLVGLARLVTEPAGRAPLAGAPRFTVASDLHNNALAIPILERSADDGPVLFPGDLTDRGSPLEAQVVRRVVRTGRPFVFVSGNHDSNTLERELAQAGAIVLTERGRLNPDGSYGAVVQRRRRAADRGLRGPVRAPQQRELRRPLPADPDPGDAGRVHELAALGPGRRRRRDGPRAGADRAGAGRPARPAAVAPADVRRRPHAPRHARAPAGRDGRQRRLDRRGRHRQPGRGGADRHRDRPRRLPGGARRSGRWPPISSRSIPPAARRPRAACGSTSDKTLRHEPDRNARRPAAEGPRRLPRGHPRARRRARR